MDSPPAAGDRRLRRVAELAAKQWHTICDYLQWSAAGFFEQLVGKIASICEQLRPKRQEMNSNSPPPDQDDDSESNDKQRPRIIQSEEILRGRREVWIEHGMEMYRLRVTSAGKLYLSK
ncbi:MAG: hemin uptake protein HemP [Pirellulales bacterium]|nr:hemin uptake protein HemP [Pirellulales bacterium]